MKSSLVRFFTFSVMAALASMTVAAATPVPGVSGQAFAEPADVAAFRRPGFSVLRENRSGLLRRRLLQAHDLKA